MIDPAGYLPNLAQLRQSFARAAAYPDDAGFLLREVGGRLLERLDLMANLKPQTILEVGCATGVMTAQLLKKYRKAQLFVVERAVPMVLRAQQRASWLRTVHGVCAEATALPCAAAQFDLIFSNLALPWTLDIDRAFVELHRLLKPGGALLFTTLGPNTLSELRHSWALANDGYQHVNAFIDLHDIGDALLRVGLSNPVVDVEHLTLTYPSVAKLAQDLRRCGARNVLHGRPLGLTGKGRWQTMLNAYQQYQQVDGRLPVSCEVIYGHAWGIAEQPKRHHPNEPALFPLARLRPRQVQE